jgi:formylglycine-generating enzyme required for sulfatase activity
LITEPGSNLPKRFKTPSGEDYIVYIDVTETTNRQLVSFLNARGNQREADAFWVKIEENEGPIKQEGEKQFSLTDEGKYAERPAVNVNYNGASAYCKWAGKALPTVAEWQAAAQPAKTGPYPWGTDSSDLAKLCANGLNRPEDNPLRRVGSFREFDRSRIGCLDMAGNVSEWCTDEGTVGCRLVCGGNIGDKDATSFLIKRTETVTQYQHHSWVGIRSVVRIKVQ